MNLRLDRVPRYIVVGAICAGVYNVTMIAGDWLGVNFVVSTLIAFVLVVSIGYALHCLFTFSEKLSLRGFARYTLGMTTTLPFSLGGIWLLRDAAHLPMWFASPFLTAVMFVWNYLVAHWAVVTRGLARKPEAAP
ncbi:MAG TPA: GtrA family protein [Caulobacteraceae bacterium]|jgi:putative flippase GtrA